LFSQQVSFGKWHLDGYDYFGTGECPAGWEDAYWYDGRRYLLDLTPEEVALWRSGKNAPDEFTWAHRIATRAERFLSEQSPERPFVLVTSFDEPRNRILDPTCAGERDRMHEALLDWMDAHIDPQRGFPWQKRAWRNARRPGWAAPTRPVRDDGARPPYLVYQTGLPVAAP
jgi:uncharacterized sulfatase